MATAAATYSKVYTCSDIALGEVLFNYVMVCGKENRDLLPGELAKHAVS